jgi:hypothetical protein
MHLLRRHAQHRLPRSYHHLHFKKEAPLVYWDLIRRHIAKERWTWLLRVIADKRLSMIGLR